MSAISSLASVIGISETSAPVTAAIGILDPETFQELAGSLQAFQYFPETVQDGKAPEWARRAVPGGSHPILSFINGGERTISFTAVFTQDENPEPQGLISSLLTGTASLSLSSLFNKERKDTVDIAKAIDYLRMFTMPRYENDVAFAPPFAIVYLPNSGIKGHPNFSDSIVGAMSQCEVTYETFHRNGAPRIVAVSLAFIEVVQVGTNWGFVGSDKFITTDWKNGIGDDSMYKRTVLGADSKKSSGGILGALGF